MDRVPRCDWYLARFESYNTNGALSFAHYIDKAAKIPIWKWLATYKGGYSEGAVLAYSNDEAF